MKLGGQVVCVTRANCFNFGEDPDPDSMIFKVILHRRDAGLKRYIARYLKTSFMGFDKTWWMCWVGDKNKPIRFWIRSGCRPGLSVGYKTLTVQPGGAMYSLECRSR